MSLSFDSCLRYSLNWILFDSVLLTILKVVIIVRTGHTATYWLERVTVLKCSTMVQFYTTLNPDDFQKNKEIRNRSFRNSFQIIQRYLLLLSHITLQDPLSEIFKMVCGCSSVIFIKWCPNLFKQITLQHFQSFWKFSKILNLPSAR